MHGSIALMREQELLVLTRLPTYQSSVQGLAWALSDAIRRTSARPDCISVTSGPGSFTGLRVGLATAKMLGMAWNVPIIPVDTLEVLALQMFHRIQYLQSNILIPVMNAYRHQVFTATWRAVPFEPIIRLSPTQVVDAGIWQTAPLTCQSNLCDSVKQELAISTEGRVEAISLVIAGPGLEKYALRIPPDRAESGARVLAGLEPMADTVATLGNSRFEAQQYLSAEAVQANYVRPSAAEEKLPK